MSDDSRSIIATHALLCGLTPLIPVPFVDDLFFAAFGRSLVGRLATLHGRDLTVSQIEILVARPKSGCALGFLVGALLYPLKKVLRKIFFFLEWKRATDVVARTYCVGFLLDLALEQNFVESHGAEKVRAALDAVLARTNTSPAKHAIAGVVGGSKNVLKNLGARLGNEATPNEKNVETARNSDLSGVSAQLQSALATLPAEFFERLRVEFLREIEAPNAPKI